MLKDLLLSLLLLLSNKQLHRRLRWVAPVVKSLEDRVLPSTALTTPRLWRGWSRFDRVWVAGLRGGGCEDKPSVQLFVVKDCSRSWDRARHPLKAISSKSGYCCWCYCCCYKMILYDHISWQILLYSRLLEMVQLLFVVLFKHCILLIKLSIIYYLENNMLV